MFYSGFARRRPAVLCVLALLLVGPGLDPARAADISDDNMRCHFADPLYNIPRLWGFMAVFDFDEAVTRPAVIDIGLLNDGETRGGGTQCDVTFTPTQFVPANFACDQPVDGIYDGVLPNRTQHGTNMKNLIAATVNDGGLAGVAGQVAVPNLYRFDEVHNYVFELYSTINRAVDDEATVINISGSFPCQWKPPFIPATTLNICTVEGRAAAVAAICTVPVLPTDAIYRTALCAAGLGSISAEGDIRDLLQFSVNRAREFGIPVVSSAGNVEAGLVGALSGAVVGNADVDDWGIIPPTLDNVIAVGAVNPDPPYENFDFHGSRVDIWAPLNDTSPAAAFISGLIAMAQAINPDLNQDTVGIDGDTGELAVDIPTTLRNLLVDTAFTNTTLDAAGHVDPTGLRGNLVDPFSFILAVSDGLIPDFRTLGYPIHFDSWVPAAFSGNDGRPSSCVPSAAELAINDPPDDPTAARRLELALGGTPDFRGAILFVSGEPIDDVDIDWLNLDHDLLSASGRHVSYLELTYLTDVGDLELTSPDDLLVAQGTETNGAETTRRYRTRQMLGDAVVPVAVKGVSEEDDNLYKLSIDTDLLTAAQPDGFETTGTSNDELATATVIHGTGSGPDVTIGGEDNSLFVSISNANFHRLGDVDVYHVQGLSFPVGDALGRIEHRIEASSPDVYLRVRNDETGIVHAGLGSVEFTRITGGSFSIEALNRFPGLYVEYDLEIHLRRETVDLGLKDRALHEWFKLQDRMTADLGRPSIPELGCIQCNLLEERATVDIRPGVAARPRDGVFGPDVSVVRFVSVSRGRPAVVTVEKGGPAAVNRVALFDAQLKRIRGQVDRDSVVFDVPDGVYALVVTDDGRGEAVTLRIGGPDRPERRDSAR